MRIDEIHESQPSQSQTQNHNLLLSQIESSLKQIETLSPQNPLPETISGDLRRSINQLTRLSPLPTSVNLLLWKLSFRLWNACVDLSNAAGSRPSEDNAKLRHVAADLLYLAGAVSGVPSPEFKSAAFYHRTGAIWHELQRYELAAECFERAADLVAKIDVSSAADAGERRLLLDLSLARARTAWEGSDRNLAIAMLSRAKSLLFGSAEHHKVVASQYLVFGKSVLANGESSGFGEALRLMNEALDLYEKGLRAVRARDDVAELKEMKSKTLRFISAVHLEMREFESVVKCVKVLRESDGEDQHPSISMLAMKAWLGLQRHGEAEKELRNVVLNNGVPESVWVSAVESYIQAIGAAGAETVKEVFLGMLGRCSVSAGAAVRVVHRVVGSNGSVGDGSKIREKVVAEIASDQRVMGLFTSEAAAKQRMAMHAVLWNCAADHFRSKDYRTSAEMFEKSMLYIPYDIENRTLRGKGFRVLCLCYLALSRLDQALEYINEAEKLEPNIASTFLKFKIYLQKNDQDAAINQVQAMTTCLDFSPEFLSLSAHEAIACHVLPVAVAALSNMLNLYATGKSMPTAEAVVLRTLVTILSQEPRNELEILKFVKRAYYRASELGADSFFGKGEIGRREWNWFAASSWNFGIKSGKEANFQQCADFLRLASDFYGLPVDGQVEENNNMVCKSLILTVSALIAWENKKKVTLTDNDVKQATELLDRAGKILKSISTSSQLKADQVNSFDDDLFFVYTICAYDIQGRLNDSASQLTIIKNFASSKACNPKYLLQIGFNASQGPHSNHEVAAFALNECLSTLLASPLPEYQNVALIVRKLIALANIHRGDTDDDAVYGMYKQAYRIMVGLKDGEYPVEEGKWLATTAWNRAALPVRLGQFDAAKKWMSVGLEIAMHVPGMENYRASMEEFLGHFEKELCVQTSATKNLSQTVVEC